MKQSMRGRLERLEAVGEGVRLSEERLVERYHVQGWVLELIDNSLASGCFTDMTLSPEERSARLDCLTHSLIDLALEAKT